MGRLPAPWKDSGLADAHPVGQRRQHLLAASTRRHVDSNRSAKPVWRWERANRTLALSRASTGSMSPAQEGRPDRIGSLFDGVCPTAATPDTGLTERLPSTRR